MAKYTRFVWNRRGIQEEDIENEEEYLVLFPLEEKIWETNPKVKNINGNGKKI